MALPGCGSLVIDKSRSDQRSADPAAFFIGVIETMKIYGNDFSSRFVN